MDFYEDYNNESETTEEEDVLIVDEIYGQNIENVPPYLGGGTSLYSQSKSYVEITLALPHSRAYTLLLHSAQQRIISNIFTKVMHELSKVVPNVINHRHVHEYCKNGVIHLHGLLAIERTTNGMAICGLLNDIAKIFGRVIRKYTLPMCKNNRVQFINPFNRCGYKRNGYSDILKRYRSPSLNLSFNNEEARFIIWSDYLKKAIVPVAQVF